MTATNSLPKPSSLPILTSEVHADADGLLKPKAYVVLKEKPGGDLDATLREHVKTSVGPWKYPRWIEVLDSLPKTATGKIQRFKLREMDAQRK